MRINFPFGNDLAESELRRNALRSKQLKNQITAAEWQIRDAIMEDNRSLISARLQVRSTAKSKQLAEQRVAQYQKNRRRGAASVKDLLDAENDLIYARNLELNAIENFSFQVARLWKDIGVLLDRQDVRIDTGKPEQVTSGEGFIPPARAEEEITTASAAPVLEPQPPQPIPPTAVKPVRAVTQVQPDKPVPAPKPAQAGKTEKTQKATFTLRIGEVFASELPAIKKKIVQAGLVPVVLDGPGKQREVIRLLIGEYKTLAAAQDALKPLENTHSGGFILKNAAGRYDTYAGSFFTRKDAEVELQRLASLKLKLSLKEVSVVLPTFILTAGSFTSRDTAMVKLDQLRKLGLEVDVLQNQTP
jgi:hypothetical protein